MNLVAFDRLQFMKPDSSVHATLGMNFKVASLAVAHNLHVHNLGLLIFVLDPPETYTRCFFFCDCQAGTVINCIACWLPVGTKGRLLLDVTIFSQ